MNSRPISSLAAVVVGSTLVACGTPQWQQSPSTNKARKNIAIQFSDATIHPHTAGSWRAAA